MGLYRVGTECFGNVSVERVFLAIFDDSLGWIFGFEEIFLEDCLGSFAAGVVLEGGGCGACVHCVGQLVSQLRSVSK